MNYKPLLGKYFYGAENAGQRAVYTVTKGLLSTASTPLTPRSVYSRVKNGIIKIAKIGGWT